MKTYRFNSADTHLDLKWMPADLWQKRLPQKYRDKGPKVVSDGKTAHWVWEGKKQGDSAVATPESENFSESVFSKGGVALESGVLPPSDPNILINHMDAAQIWAATIFGPTRKPLFEDQDLGFACNRAYNDFLLELNASNPNRLFASLNVPNQSFEESIKETKRAIEAGMRAVEFSIYTAVEPIWHPGWEPVWSLLEEANVVLSFHIGGKAGEPYPPKENGRYPAHFCYSPFALQTAMAQVVFSGVLDRHPKLKVVFAECRVGWLPFFIEHMDRQARERPTDVKLSLKPSEYWQRQMAGTFEDDVVGARLLTDPASRLQYMVMWGSDYPHNSVTWPNTVALMGWLMKDVPQEVYFDAVFGRFAKFYGVSEPKGLIKEKPQAGIAQHSVAV